MWTFPKIVRRTVEEIGYTRGHKYGFDADTCAVLTCIDEQSPDIALGVNKALEYREERRPAAMMHAPAPGDQGMMFGLPATKKPELMPYAYFLGP